MHGLAVGGAWAGGTINLDCVADVEASVPAVNAALARLEAEDTWVFLLCAGETIDGFEAIERATRLLAVNDAFVGEALAVRVVLSRAGGRIQEALQARAWRTGKGIHLDNNGCPVRADGTYMRMVAAVDGCTINRCADGLLSGVPDATPTRVDFPDPLPLSTKLREQPVDLATWNALLETSVIGLGMAALAVVQEYPGVAPKPEAVRMAVGRLRGLLAQGMLGPKRDIEHLTDALAMKAPPAPVATPTPLPKSKSTLQAQASTELGSVLGRTCFVPGTTASAAGYGNCLERIGLTPVSPKLAQQMLALECPLLFLSYSEGVRKLGEAHPGFVHVLWLDASEDPRGRVLDAHKAGHIRLWRTQWAPPIDPTVTALPLTWIPKDYRSGARENAVLVIGSTDAATRVKELAASKRYNTVYTECAEPGLAEDVAKASSGVTQLSQVAPLDIQSMFDLMRKVSRTMTSTPLLAALAQVAENPDRVPAGSSEALDLLARAGFPCDILARRTDNVPTRSVLLIADVKGWSLDVNLQAIEKILTGADIEVRRWYLSEDGREIPTDYDAYYLPFWHPLAIPPEKLLGALRTQWFQPGQPGPPTSQEWAWLRRCAAFALPNKRAMDEFTAYGVDSRVTYLGNPVDMDRFPTRTDVRKVKAVWAGSYRHLTHSTGDAKGLETIVKPVCAKLDVPLHIAEKETAALPPEQMHEFYRHGSVYLNASAHDGASNAVMEAMACGLVVISTDTGNVREMQEKQLEAYGESGIIIVDRSVEAFTAALEDMIHPGDPQRTEAMFNGRGALNRASIEKDWSVDAWSERYLDFFEKVL